MELPKQIGEFKLVGLENESLVEKIKRVYKEGKGDLKLQDFVILLNEQEQTLPVASYRFLDGHFGTVDMYIGSFYLPSVDEIKLVLEICQETPDYPDPEATFPLSGISSDADIYEAARVFVKTVRQAQQDGRFWDYVPLEIADRQIGQFW